MDVLIVGGGPAGLTAALMLGRGRRHVGVVDAGSPRHAVSEGVHNFLTRDGMPPAALREEAWSQMRAYPSVTHIGGRVSTLSRTAAGWDVTGTRGQRWSARAVLLATGVIDEHPEIPGYAERWGHAIHHCPYCHGWEVQDQPLGLVAHGAHAEHMAPLLQNWSADVAVFTHGEDAGPDLRRLLSARGIPWFEQPIAELEGDGPDLRAVRLADGTTVPRRALFVQARQRQVDLVRTLGLALTDAGYVEVDDMQATSEAGVWAAGDLTTPMQQVVAAAAQGARAAAAIHMALTVA